ncbi:LPXTG cell wall anchor domain-containing protein [Mediterraneibacter gnavus]|uniref:LPXTG cell wall anchor domain-containing protein n=1 Tax=Mediterraneibacter gnavus TaxID=33038 RepID=A0A9X3HKB5_MEDGN|nr:LPXTG cell wall anchor domain-containing protein [Mediterraneibacter gnavus]MCZ7695238.1 LPXTG cell wall anchor domain-containing protein [Mediterraneibacter gnavus]MCZ7736799.1 LPXTG cell wall anchor domain-containing protein [Mediterraneibacter gnavus]MDC6148444.1 LPXTG cell wall anchor domain-containing protein [Mediterraneibacter gnavus]MDE1201861.1 LPXTG cell wall anchor domain-containing protein [Mediterraneibacter gnavus]
MKKKFVVALVAAMSLTVAGTGTVFAMDKVSTIASEKEHVHGDNCEWVVDKEAWTEEVVHPAETKQEWVVDKEAWTENILKYKCVCNGCHAEFASDEEWAAHDKAAAMNGDFSHGSYTNVPYYETVEHPEEGHYQEVVVKPSWTETVEHPEEGHWVCNGEPQEPDQKPENPDQKPEQPENPEQKPEQPENPDQKPEQPENPDVETPETPDAENPETPEQKPEAGTTPEENKENVQTQETETKKEGTSPKTGDTTSALPVAGAGLASLGVALATILKKRK